MSIKKDAYWQSPQDISKLYIKEKESLEINEVNKYDNRVC